MGRKAAIDEKLMMLPLPASTMGLRNTCVGITVPVRLRLSTVAVEDVLAVLFNHGLIHDIGLVKRGFASGLANVVNDGVANFLLAAHDGHFGPFEGEIFGNGTAQHSCAAGDDYHVVFDIEK